MKSEEYELQLLKSDSRYFTELNKILKIQKKSNIIKTFSFEEDTEVWSESNMKTPFDYFIENFIISFTIGNSINYPIGSNEVNYKNGYEISPDGKFPELLDRVASIEGVKRLRFSSPHPQDVDDHMLQVMSSHKNICDHVHLPLQSGNDRILNRMNRSYSSSDFLSLSKKIREYMPGCSITTDIIVGFPGETEEEFEDTLRIVREVGFNFAFMFKYSSRPGTKASEYTDQISEEVKQDRLERLIALQLKNTLSQNRALIGQTFKVLIEKESKKSKEQWAGRTEGNIWVVFDKGNESVGDLIDVKIEDARGVTLFGTNINQEYRYEVA